MTIMRDTDMTFVRAERQPTYIKMLTYSPSSMTALHTSIGMAFTVASALDGRMAVIETTFKADGQPACCLYADQFDFDYLALKDNHSPETFIKAIDTAVKAGYKAIVIHDVSHEWDGKQGILSSLNSTAKRATRGDTHSAWAILNPRHDAFIDAIETAPAHIFCVARGKERTKRQKSDTGKTEIVSVGFMPVQRQFFESHFDTVASMEVGRLLMIEEAICHELQPSYHLQSRELAKTLLRWASQRVTHSTPASMDKAQDSQYTVAGIIDDAPLWDDVLEGRARVYVKIAGDETALKKVMDAKAHKFMDFAGEIITLAPNDRVYIDDIELPVDEEPTPPPHDEAPSEPEAMEEPPAEDVPEEENQEVKSGVVVKVVTSRKPGSKTKKMHKLYLRLDDETNKTVNIFTRNMFKHAGWMEKGSKGKDWLEIGAHELATPIPVTIGKKPDNRFWELVEVAPVNHMNPITPNGSES